MQHDHWLATLCNHTPQCIKKPIAAESCCLAALDEKDVTEAIVDDSGALSGVLTFDDFLLLSQESAPWQSSAEQFDTSIELASENATPPPASTPPPINPPPPQSPLSPPAWHPGDDRESQDTKAPSDFIADDDNF
jgi:hypothetical protein